MKESFLNLFKKSQNIHILKLSLGQQQAAARKQLTRHFASYDFCNLGMSLVVPTDRKQNTLLGQFWQVKPKIYPPKTYPKSHFPPPDKLVLLVWLLRDAVIHPPHCGHQKLLGLYAPGRKIHGWMSVEHYSGGKNMLWAQHYLALCWKVLYLEGRGLNQLKNNCISILQPMTYCKTSPATT